MKRFKVVLAILGLTAVAIAGHSAVRAAFPKADCCTGGCCHDGGSCCQKP